jgi:hypothetical protein
VASPNHQPLPGTDIVALGGWAQVDIIEAVLNSNDHALYPLVGRDNLLFGTILRDTLCTLLYHGAFSQSTEVRGMTVIRA